jgi:small subunit ribosomal protein S13
MARIFGIDLPRDKRIEAALPYLFGIGPSRTRKILKDLNIDPNKRSKDVSED